ncbi:hypothetical protein PLAN_30103 [Planktothrix rubescens CCAP 1459/22]|uniref:Uncharacterized protein n=1 Tax=Planktothrix rubescens CCAP 1459/22 TaxID=329571 RepID=A0A6J7ZKS2_PLARU|nr:hypothetical protein PLAN_30103 [Planktothrix rubescens NIVA-CYA 18]
MHRSNFEISIYRRIVSIKSQDKDERFNLTNFQRFKDKTFKILVHKAINRNIFFSYD